jgi:septum formation protein
MDDPCPQGPFRPATTLILASASPRRQHLLALLGLTFDVVPGRSPEPARDLDEAPEAYTRRLARAKAAEVLGRTGYGLVIGADTNVVLDDQVLGKPASAGEALATLQRLSGRSHRVITACCLLQPASGRELSFAVTTQVWMGAFSPQVLEAYVRTGDPLDKAGSYGIQSGGGFLVERLEGSYSNVVGLPLTETVAALQELGAISSAPGDRG